MEYIFTPSGFEGRSLALRWGAILDFVQLHDGGSRVPAAGPRMRFMLVRNDGREVEVLVHRGLVDPAIAVTVDGERLPIPHNNQLLAALLAFFPLLLCFGGVIGSFLGFAASIYNLTVLRSSRPSIEKVGICVTVAAVAIGAWFISAIALVAAFTQ